MILQTERLILREFVHEDWPAVLAYQRKPLYLRTYAWRERTAESVREFVGVFVKQQREDPRLKFQLAVTLRTDGRLIGNCGLRLRSAGSPVGDIGFELDSGYWGQGYATEAARSMVDLGFSQQGLHRVEAWCVADNVASARVLERLGMRREGCLREVEFYKGRWWDRLLFGLLESEWRPDAQELSRRDGRRDHARD